MVSLSIFYFGFTKPRLDNAEKYTDYQLTAMKLHDEIYGEDAKGWSETAILKSMRQEKEFQCLDRYRDENYPFAQALTVCKKEALIP